MRIKEEFKQLGNFWHSSTPREKVPGTLSISDGGTVELEIVHQFDRRPPFGGIGLGHGGKRIVGQLANSKIVTLDDCFYKSIGGSLSVSKSVIRVGRVFTGIGYDEAEIPHFDSLTFSVEGIDEWVGITGINVDYLHEEHTPTISYHRPETISLNLGDGMQLLITFGLGTRITHIKEAGISQKTYFTLTSQDARKLDDFISVVRKITHFLCFAMDQVVSLDSMSAAVDNLHQDLGRDPAGPVQVDIYYPSWPYSKDEPEIQQHEILFGFEQIQSDAERVISNWIAAYEKINPTFDLYFSTQIGQPYLTVKFLTLVQGLEAYHHREKSLEAYRRRKKGDKELHTIAIAYGIYKRVARED